MARSKHQIALIKEQIYLHSLEKGMAAGELAELLDEDPELIRLFANRLVSDGYLTRSNEKRLTSQNKLMTFTIYLANKQKPYEVEKTEEHPLITANKKVYMLSNTRHNQSPDKKKKDNISIGSSFNIAGW